MNTTKSERTGDPCDPMVIAFYLPQFHPIAENDEHWGRGFTEWRNVVAARPLFPGHLQPRLPADLGYYDLRVPEVQFQQSALAHAGGVDAFCYYHYWFNGHQVLERPLNQHLAAKDLDQPFCICWANEDWTRAWDGATSEVLLHQRYSPDDDRAHIRSLMPVLCDDRYVTIDGRPLLLIYRTENLPDPRRTADMWRDELQREGFPDPLLTAVQSLHLTDPSEIGFDASVRFAPNWYRVMRARDPLRSQYVKVVSAAERRISRGGRQRRKEVTVLNYDEFIAGLSDPGLITPTSMPCVAPGWDNSPRRPTGGSFVIHGSDPARYEEWMVRALAECQEVGKVAPVVFVNAWNEWAEGAVLEPCQRWGRDYLEATRRARCRSVPTKVGAT